jgi:3-dehydroquinate synthetase
MRSTTFEGALAYDPEAEEANVTPLPVARICPRPPPSSWASISMDCLARTGYEVTLCDPLAESGALAQVIGERKALLVTTPTVDRVHGSAIRRALAKTDAVSMLVLNAREESKSMDLVHAVCAEALARGINRRGLLVSFGGGVCSDIVTLAASLIRRGVGHVRIPTTLIGQIDAGIGLKGAVNFCGKKSFVGCFHPPEQVLIDSSLLRTLPPRFLISGLAEAFKMGIGRDESLFALLARRSRDLVESGFADEAAREVLQRSIWSMLDELRKNPYEDQSYERLVDFGHTFSPALEAALDFRIHHGEAVAIDIALSSTIASCLGLLDNDGWEEIVGALEAASLPISSPRLDLELGRSALTEACRHRGGSMNLVVPSAVGHATFLRRREELADPVLIEAIDRIAARAGAGK